jgi:exopolysaccharide biosynthesis polyprenyl glycosylphosphotransferase
MLSDYPVAPAATPLVVRDGPRRLPLAGRTDVGEETRRRDSIYRRSLAACDALATVFALLLSAVLVGGLGLRWPVAVWALCLVLVAKIAGLYDHDNLVLRRSTLDEVPALFQLATLNALGIWLAESVLLDGRLTHFDVALLWTSFLSIVLLGRSTTRALMRRATKTERCMVVGSIAVWEKLRQSFAARSGADIVSYFALRRREGGRYEPLGLQLSAARSRLRDAIERDEVHRVIIAMEDDVIDHNLEGILLLRSLGMKVSVIPQMPEVVGSAGEFEDLDGMPILGIRALGLPRSSLFIKRSFDVVVSGIALLIMAPVFASIALAVRMGSKGPVFFRQARVGRNGNVFEMLKFRTMLDGAERDREGLLHLNETDGLFKIADDPRVTPIGRLLRSCSLDELPQLINVLRGEMSLVGPRPLVIEEDRLVQGWARRRLDLTPGMTGHWQVLGARRVPLDEMVKIDYLYIANWSLWSDIKALLRTLPHVVARRGL